MTILRAVQNFIYLRKYWLVEVNIGHLENITPSANANAPPVLSVIISKEKNDWHLCYNEIPERIGKCQALHKAVA